MFTPSLQIISWSQRTNTLHLRSICANNNNYNDDDDADDDDGGDDDYDTRNTGRGQRYIALMTWSRNDGAK